MTGHWEGAHPFNSWRRVGIVLLVLAALLIASLILPKVANASAGCASRSRTWHYRVAGVTVMWWRVTASGCWNASNSKVTSFSIGATGDGVIPYRYSGIIGREPIGAVGSHQVGKRLTGRFDTCVPPFPCVQVWSPWARFILDSYGNWDISPPAT